MAQRDDFSGEGPTLVSPGEKFYVVSPSDTVDLPVVPRAILCSQSGTVVADGAPDNLVNTSEVSIPVVGGAMYPIRPRRIYLSGTSAGTIIAII